MSDQTLPERPRFGSIFGTGDERRPGIASPRWLANSLSALGFWSAIALPALYFPLLFAGLDSANDLVVFLGLFALHVVALLLGRSHRRG